MPAEVTVADCERAQAAWFETRVAVLGGQVHEVDGSRWLDGVDGVNLMFPARPTPRAAAAGIDAARARQVLAGVWLGLDVDPTPLAAAGFEPGWSPWWMTAPVADVGPALDDRVVLRETSDDYGGEHAAYRATLALCRERPRHTWYAAAYTRRSRRFAGQAWAHVPPGAGHAGVFDMEVWPRLRRRGFGTGLLRAVCAAAAEAGATQAVLNATPEGKALYDTCGFRQIGAGSTWWWHPPTPVPGPMSPTLTP